jgi:tetraacyldisaccharide 4'-kinase
VRAWLESLWYSARRPPWPLRLLSTVYAIGMRHRRRTARADAAGVGRPVVVIGNITVGGTGKTPLTLWLAAALRAHGVRIGVILRGYGAQAPERVVTRVEPDSDPLRVGDEALVIRRRGGPVAVGRERAAAARSLAPEVDLILADDGLQHRALARDFEIAVVDGARGCGNGWLLPAGPLREPMSRLAAVDAIVINGPADAITRSQLAASAAAAGRVPPPLLRMVVQARRAVALDASVGAPGVPLSDFAGQSVHAVAGLGNPQRFFQTLRSAGIAVREHAFPDHHHYRAADLEFTDPLPILMTEKDAVKCGAFAGPARWYVPVDAVLEESDAQQLLAPLLRLAHA